MRICIFSIICSLFLLACEGSKNFSPKPRAFPRVVYPEKTYTSFDQDYCNFTFLVPSYAEIQQDTLFFEEKPAHPCWFDIYFPQFNSRIHCSYYPVGEEKSFSQLKTDAFELVDWHNKRANYIEERRIQKPEEEVYGFAFQIEGPAASPFQFYLTDSSRHFLRGALYFNTQVRPDSLAPVKAFIMKDIERMIETFTWTDSQG
ncbi:MAG: hypothetical protein R3350_09010 [Saprospiraceae bacterium]|nr:hypothetical protein [Saprospiraceae bacterium]